MPALHIFPQSRLFNTTTFTKHYFNPRFTRDVFLGEASKEAQSLLKLTDMTSEELEAVWDATHFAVYPEKALAAWSKSHKGVKAPVLNEDLTILVSRVSTILGPSRLDWMNSRNAASVVNAHVHSILVAEYGYKPIFQTSSAYYNTSANEIRDFLQTALSAGVFPAKDAAGNRYEPFKDHPLFLDGAVAAENYDDDDSGSATPPSSEPDVPSDPFDHVTNEADKKAATDVFMKDRQFVLAMKKIGYGPVSEDCHELFRQLQTVCCVLPSCYHLIQTTKCYVDYLENV